MHSSTSKLLIAATLFFLSGAAIADGWGGLGGTSAKGDYIGVTPCEHDPLGCSNPPPEDGFAVFIRKKGAKDAGEYYKSQRCAFTTNKAGERVRLTCTKGDSPLAGVTYKIVHNKNPDDCSYENKYICISGCNKPSVPLVLLHSYWECE